MSAELLASDVIIVEEDPKYSSLPAIPTAILGAVGVTEMGPFTPTVATSFEKWSDLFGGLVSTSDLAIAAMGFFLNGGQTLWTKRTCHYSPNVNDEANRQSAAATVTLTTTGAATQGSVTGTESETFEMDPGDTLTLKVDGGGEETATFDAAAGTVTGSGGTYPTGFSGSETLILEMSGGESQTITFTAGASTLAQVIDEINPALTDGYADEDTSELRLTSDQKGTGADVYITGGTALATLGLSTGHNYGTGDVANIDAVTATEADTIIEADTTAQVTVASGQLTVLTPTVGASGSIQITATGTLETVFGFDTSVHSGTAAGPGNMGTIDAKYEGAYGNNLKAVVAAASSGDSDEFNVTITVNDVDQEIFPNLSTVLTATRYWETFLNSSTTGSKLVTATDLLTGTPPDNRPDNGSFTLTGGDDGLTGLDDNDFIGSDAGDTGLYGLDQVDNLTLLIVPGRGTSAVHQAMLTYCETWRSGQVFAILDPPASNTVSQIITYVKTTAALQNFSEFGAIYWPRIKIVNPNTSEYTSDANGLVTVPPSGFIAGVYARTDGAKPGGIYQPPAGVDRGIIYGCQGFESDSVLDKRQRDLLYPELINPLMAEDGSPRHIDGTKTLKETGDYPQVQQRRGISYIERTIRSGLRFARHSNNTRAVRQRCYRTVYMFLLSQLRLEAFASDDPNVAFSVNFSDKLNPISVQRAKKLIGRVTVLSNTSADYVIIYIAQDTRALDAEIAELAQGR